MYEEARMNNSTQLPPQHDLLPPHTPPSTDIPLPDAIGRKALFEINLKVPLSPPPTLAQNVARTLGRLTSTPGIATPNPDDPLFIRL